MRSLDAQDASRSGRSPPAPSTAHLHMRRRRRTAHCQQREEELPLASPTRPSARPRAVVPTRRCHRQRRPCLLGPSSVHPPGPLHGLRRRSHGQICSPSAGSRHSERNGASPRRRPADRQSLRHSAPRLAGVLPAGRSRLLRKRRRRRQDGDLPSGPLHAPTGPGDASVVLSRISPGSHPATWPSGFFGRGYPGRHRRKFRHPSLRPTGRTPAL